MSNRFYVFSALFEKRLKKIKLYKQPWGDHIYKHFLSVKHGMPTLLRFICGNGKQNNILPNY